MIQILVILILTASIAYNGYRVYRPKPSPVSPFGQAVAGLITTVIWTALLTFGGFFS